MNNQPVILTDAPASTPKSFTLAAMPHNAQPGQGSVGHWMPVKRRGAPGCAMCGSEQKFAQRGGKAGLWCERCGFFTQTEG